MTLTIASIQSPAETERFLGLLAQSFHARAMHWETWVRRIGESNLRLAHRDGQVIGGLGFYRMGQWFGGRSLPMAGIAGVAMAPEHRASGHAATMMTHTLQELRELGFPLSGLYASTQRLYRSVGYEQAGSHVGYRIRLSAIGRLGSPLPMHPVDASDLDAFQQLANARGRITNGNLDRNAALWERLFNFLDKKTYAYLIGDRAQPAGYVVYYQDGDGHYDLHIRDMVALSGAAAETLWSFFHGHRSMASNLHWYGPSNDPLLLFPGELPLETFDQFNWMLRIVDVRSALEQRGYPPWVSGELHLEVRDEQVAENNGRFVLTVSAGEASVAAGGRGDLRGDIRGLAPLYSGFFTPQQLQAAGCIESNPESLSVATRLFGGAEPWMPDMF